MGSFYLHLRCVKGFCMMNRRERWVRPPSGDSRGEIPRGSKTTPPHPPGTTILARQIRRALITATTAYRV